MNRRRQDKTNHLIIIGQYLIKHQRKEILLLKLILIREQMYFEIQLSIIKQQVYQTV